MPDVGAGGQHKRAVVGLRVIGCKRTCRHKQRSDPPYRNSPRTQEGSGVARELAEADRGRPEWLKVVPPGGLVMLGAIIALLGALVR